VKSEVESIEDAVSSMEVDDGEKKKKKKKKKSVSREFIRWKRIIYKDICKKMSYRCRFNLSISIKFMIFLFKIKTTLILIF